MGCTWTLSRSIPFPPMSMTIFCPSPVLRWDGEGVSFSQTLGGATNAPVVSVRGGEVHEIRAVLVEESILREVGSVTTCSSSSSSASCPETASSSASGRSRAQNAPVARTTGPYSLNVLPSCVYSTPITASPSLMSLVAAAFLMI